MPKGDYKQLKADPEDGTTPIAWIFLEAIPLAQLSGLEIRCILHLWRETYGRLSRDGVRPKDKELSLVDWVKHTGGERSRVSRALTCLVDWHVLIRESLGTGKGYIYRMNTHISEWSDEILDKAKLAEILRVEITTTVENRTTVEIRPTVVQIDTATVEKQTTPVASNSGTLNKGYKERSTTSPTAEGNAHLQVDNFLEILPRVSGWDFDKVADSLWLADFIGDFPETQLSEIRACTDFYSSKEQVDKGVWKTRLRRWMKREREWHKEKGARNGKGNKDTGQGGKERVAGSRPKEDYEPGKPWYGPK
jgi:hypothetical protein